VAAALLLAPSLAAAASSLPGLMAGVYKTHFKSGLVDGEAYTAENILEIVPYKDDAAYFRIHLDFYNGHECGISGIARATAGALVYHGPKDYTGAPCILTLRRAADGIHLYEDENGSCRNQTCGARGGYGYKADNPADFPAAGQRPIRYLPRLLASSEYADAVKEYAAAPR
jgi:hypothetical protein